MESQPNLFFLLECYFQTNFTIHCFVFCRYLNTHLKKQRLDYGEISPYSISVGPDAMEEVMDVGAVS